MDKNVCVAKMWEDVELGGQGNSFVLESEKWGIGKHGSAIFPRLKNASERMRKID